MILFLLNYDITCLFYSHFYVIIIIPADVIDFNLITCAFDTFTIISTRYLSIVHVNNILLPYLNKVKIYIG